MLDSKFVHHTYTIISGDRNENDSAYRICKFVHDSYYRWQYFQWGCRSRNDCANRFLNLCTTCASIPHRRGFFFISHTEEKVKWQREPVWNKL